MKRYRDAESGEFLTEEEALIRDRSTWVQEEISPKKLSPSLNTEDLKNLYNIIVERHVVIDDEAVIKVTKLKDVFQALGVSFE